MSPDDYIGRTLRHRATGHEGTITGHVTNILGQVRFRIRYADSAEQLSIAQILAAFDWTDEPAVVALPENVVPFRGKGPWRVVPIDPGSGDAA
jgi:hypothetical protein